MAVASGTGFPSEVRGGAPGVLPATTHLRRFGPEQAVFVEDETAEEVYEVAEGVVRLCKLLPDGRRAVLGFAWPGDLLGLAPGPSHGCTAEAVTVTSLRACARRSLEALADGSAELRRRLAAQLRRELEAAHGRLVQLGRMTARERMASFLVALARRQQDSMVSGRLVLPMSRTDVADHLGLTAETVSRTLTQLKRKGVIALPRPQEVVVLRPAALRALAGEAGMAEAGAPALRHAA